MFQKTSSFLFFILMMSNFSGCTRAVFVGALASRPTTDGGGLNSSFDANLSNHDSQANDTNRPEASRTIDLALPAGAVGFLAGISSGGAFLYGTKSDHTLWTWPSDYKPSPPVLKQFGTDNNWLMIESGGGHICGLKNDHSLWCWGNNYYGQLGEGLSGSGVYLDSPLHVGTDTNWLTLGLGGNHTCAIKNDHSLWCWGSNSNGELGDGANFDQTAPTKIGSAADWQSLSLGTWHTCAIKTDGSLWCWGNNNNGELGDGTKNNSNVPIRIGTANDWESVECGMRHTCAIKTDHSLWCWGANTSGQLGFTPANNLIPSRLGLDNNWRNISLGQTHTCAIKLDQTLWCWGLNVAGQLDFNNTGDTTNKTSPTQMGTAAGWKSVSPGNYFTCALKIDDTLWCWGDYSYVPGG